MKMAKVSTMRAHKVAMAAPLTPIRGAPRLPKIRMAFRLILVTRARLEVISPTDTFSTLRWAASIQVLMLKKI